MGMRHSTGLDWSQEGDSRMHIEWNRTRTGLRCLAATGCLLAAHGAKAQTQIDLRTQSKSVDFSAATSTKPSKTGTTVPASCAVGETFFKTNATAGQNLYGCTATNTWTVLGAASGGGGGGGVVSPRNSVARASASLRRNRRESRARSRPTWSAPRDRWTP